MKEIQLSLIPQPGSTAECLARVTVVDPSPAVVKIWAESLPSNLVLEGYTRDSWAWKPSTQFITMTVQSVDGRGKIPGFLDYLQQRQKCAYGRFSPKSSNSSSQTTTALCVIAYVQKQQSSKDRLEWRICLDNRTIPTMNLPPLTMSMTTPSTSSKSTDSTNNNNNNTKTTKGVGLLGKLVGAQHRTNEHVAEAVAPSSRSQRVVLTKPTGMTTSSAVVDTPLNMAATSSTVPTKSSLLGESSLSTSNTVGGGPSVVNRSSATVLAEFRQKMMDRLLDFDIREDDEVLKVPITLVEHQAGLAPDDKARVTMEILKYMVYEAAEEVNEEWVTYNEPTEFIDEAVIVIYKEGAAPPEVLEEINKGELPDEVRGQQRAIQEERIRQANQKAAQHKQRVEIDAHRAWNEVGGDIDDNDALAALNQNKRDRRTIEDFEREKARKRGRDS